MPTVSVAVTNLIEGSVAEVWDVLGAFGDLPSISSATASSRLEDHGRVRVLGNRDGGILWERLTHFDDEQRRLSYVIFDTKACESLAYGVGYRGTVEVGTGATPGTARFDYSAEFLPNPNVSRQAAEAAVTAFAADVSEGVRRILARRRREAQRVAF